MVPNGWSLVKLGDILTLGSGDTKPDDLQKEYSDDSPYPVYGGNNIMGYSSQKNSSDSVILIGRVGEYCGVTRYIDKACWITDNALYTKKVSSEIDKEYLVSKLKKFDLSRLRNKGGQPLVSQKPIYAVKLPMPPLPEQRKIAKILSTWDKAITTTERLIATSKQQKKALMQQLLTGKKRLIDPETGEAFEGDWEEVKLGDVLTKISNGLTYDSKATQGLPVSRIETISTGKVNHAKVGYAPNDEKTIKFKLQFGDILYSHINSLEHIGRVAYFLDDKDLYHGMNLLLLRASKDADSKFIYFMLSSSLGKEFARSHAKSAVNQASISTTDLKGFKAKLPGLGEQQKIASVLTAADKEIELLQAKLAHLKEEKKALMQQLLTGKRRVKVEEQLEIVS
ncbi:TPA: restriction endonuclease subunit S [Serratia marcescens]|uniref:Restriction endonuclease subunit S n=7 Tax=Enterobacter cloacae complex TaxID=354276 RepID=A0A855VMI6_9ENTR|nr:MULTISPECIES: restriction endonuclease subunit S [Enterobacteriaceae]AVO81480.1 restriction endonuclease subunit S [Enterobacter cloacae complex sp.]EKT9721501.1 restriction endonuclease subunit S [Klebsiella variicola]EKU7624351.1 restriction endonuclease subunit S [Citrobacter freundii]EKW2141738.1 restriction endonuclease subunit S [Citrobacter braakii]MCU2955229.1 restriction endonuclease subunit S [Enterobacter hormaechei subsp. hoffmannii]MDS6630445.1 restriction endonuclease subunit